MRCTWIGRLVARRIAATRSGKNRRAGAKWPSATSTCSRSKRPDVPTLYEFSQEAPERGAKVSNIPGPVLRFGRDLDQATISNERRKRFGVGKRMNEVLLRSDDQGWSGDAARFG